MSFNQNFGQTMGQTVQVIGFGRRFLAYLIDAILLSVVGNVLGLVVGLAIGVAGAAAGGSSDEVGAAAQLVAGCLGFLLGAIYYIGFWATTGQTLGKMALGIKVIGVDGTPVSWGTAAMRYLGYLVSGLVLALGFIWIAFDPRRQGWHDKIASTYVVRKETNFSASDNVTFVPSDSGSSAAIIIVALVSLFILVPICIIAVLLLLGPVVGNVFSNIVENLGTPTPR
ncbi:MAG: RDD family protein [Anaerolineae bacterium]|nr:RDD family protein [Anaerolineae bacterium]